MTMLVPTYECEFRIGQAVKLAKPYAEYDPDQIYYVLGINWEHRQVANHGWSINIATEEDILRGYGSTDGFRPSDLVPNYGGERFGLKTYRLEWCAQTGHVDQYGQNFKPDYIKAFPTREEAKAHLETIAKYNERLMRWETDKGYHEGRLVHRETLIETRGARG